MQTMVNTDELYVMIKRAVREVLHDELEAFWQRTIPFASQAEMNDIIEHYGTPLTTKDVAYSETISL